MDIKSFNTRYKKKGGTEKLIKMSSELCTLKEIAEHFGVGRERIRQWLFNMTGKKYDPRHTRRALKVEEIKNLLKTSKITNEEIRQLKKTNCYYLRIALEELTK